MKMNESHVPADDTAIRMPAEWEDHEAVMMAWPHPATDWNYMLGEARDCFFNIICAIARNEKVILVGPEAPGAEYMMRLIDDHTRPDRNITCINTPTNDTWARDFGPISVYGPDGAYAVDFIFNGWGDKFPSAKDNDVNHRLDTLPAGSLWSRFKSIPFVLEGGSVETDGKGTLLTTSRCLLAPTRNPSMSKAEIEALLGRELGFDHFLWLDHGALAGDDTDSHIDTLARLAPDDTIIYTGPGEAGDPNNEELILMREELRAFRTREGHPFNLVELPLPSPIYDADGMQLPATYANYLVGPRHIYMPVYGQPAKDKLAAQMIQIAYPDREIVTIDCRALIQQHGSLHCVTMQIHNGILNR